MNQAAYSLFLFIRDICEGDFVTWIDEQLSAADGNGEPAGRSSRMRAALLDPLRNVAGISDKLWSMILADLLLGGDPQRERWVTTGASFVAVDTLVHAFLHRTGILGRFAAEHSYGDRCFADGGCAEAFLDTLNYPVEEHLSGETRFLSLLDRYRARYPDSEGVSDSYEYFPIIFVKDRAFSGFNEGVREAIADEIQR